jgi:hypothetical protein
MSGTWDAPNPSAGTWDLAPARKSGGTMNDSSVGRREMKIIAILALLTCLSPGILADDFATPSPTPVYTHPLVRRGALRRAEQSDRRRTRQVETESRGQARAKAKANRRSASTGLAQSREAARAREQAQREVAVQNRIEAACATPHPTSDVMSRMGFSEEEIATQKAREQSAQPGAKEAENARAQARSQQPSKSQSGTGTRDLGQQPALSPATAKDASAQKAIDASSAADSDSH